MIKKCFTGTGVALVTPFLEDGNVDFDALERLVEEVILNHVDYLVMLCTTSETPTLSSREREQIAKRVIAVNAGRVPVVCGMGGPSTHEIIEHFREWNFTGIDAILSVSPYYNRPTQEGIYQHYCALAAEAPRPIIVYNVPARTGSNIEADTTLRLAHDCPNIIAVKEASGIMNQIMRIIKHKPADFAVISGDDAITLPLLAVGASGVISVVANAFPREMSTLVQAALNGNFADAQQQHLALLDLIQACFKEGNPAGIKAILALQGKIQNNLRLPQVPISDSLREQMQHLLIS